MALRVPEEDLALNTGGRLELVRKFLTVSHRFIATLSVEAAKG